jgi:hypothetical protein
MSSTEPAKHTIYAWKAKYGGGNAYVLFVGLHT